MARPRKGEEKDRPKHIGFRTATWVWEGVQRLAAERSQPASEVAHDLLEIALGRFGIRPSPEPASPAGAAPKPARPARTKRAR
jgi:hypothetical protein